MGGTCTYRDVEAHGKVADPVEAGMEEEYGRGRASTGRVGEEHEKRQRQHAEGWMGRSIILRHYLF